jgi:hypothetical protein
VAAAPYKNETDYDAGRFRYLLTFFVPTDEQGGTWTQVAQRRAIRIPIVRRQNLEGYLQLNAGESALYDMWDFVIRVGSFIPTKDMVVVNRGDVYTIRVIQEVDEPANYLKLACVKTDLNLTT